MDDFYPNLIEAIIISIYSVAKVVALIKILTAREIFKRCPQMKRTLWGEEFWTDG
ncbi:transposase [Photorhabdus sp. SF281]|uniref:transposase n=1 Tax=Photorhabdus sp. SF281 TaxID=3459527 RepID=UPI004043C7B2